MLRFLQGQNLREKNVAFQPGTIYLDTATKEMWFDDPSQTTMRHQKIVDLDTLVYLIEETVQFNPVVDNDAGSLGMAVLGTMIIGWD